MGEQREKMDWELTDGHGREWEYKLHSHSPLPWKQSSGWVPMMGRICEKDGFWAWTEKEKIMKVKLYIVSHQESVIYTNNSL